jgi:undecaprenyl-diphosphatase
MTDSPPAGRGPEGQGRRSDRRTGRGETTRGHLQWVWNFAFVIIRWLAAHVRNVYATFGIFLSAGAIIAVAFTWGFAQIAGHVRAGGTQAFDDAVMRFVGDHQNAVMRNIMIEVTTLGTGSVVAMLVLISGLFLWLNNHRHSAALLAIATLGGIVLNNLLKMGFDRPRPQIFEWGTHAMSSSFPSGHAMSAAIVYSTVAYLAARLQRNHASRILTMTFAALMIVSIAASRIYLGVHYPSDVLAGAIIGLAWAAFCMAVLEATQLYAKRNAPELLAVETPAPAPGAVEPTPKATPVRG